MDDNPVSSDAEPEAPRPRSLAFAAVSTGLIGLAHARVAEDQLDLANEGSLATPTSYGEAFRHAQWRAAQQHRAVVVGMEVATLVLSVTLFLASVRVFLRVRGAGWLWRQALLGNIALAAFTVLIERYLMPSRLSAVRQVLATGGAAVQLPPNVTAESVFRVSMLSGWVMVALLLGVLYFSTRPRIRAFLD